MLGASSIPHIARLDQEENRIIISFYQSRSGENMNFESELDKNQNAHKNTWQENL